MESIWQWKRWSLQQRVARGHEQPPSAPTEMKEHPFRTVFLNNPSATLQYGYMGNKISTTKYNIFTFLPKGLFEQFRRTANVYFLVIAVLSFTPMSPIQPITNILPLAFVLIVSLSKEAFEDWKRHKKDKMINSSLAEVLEGDSWMKRSWSQLVVGNIIRVKNKEYFPADLLLLSSSNDDGYCYVETSNLDGESSLKRRTALEQTWKYCDPKEISTVAGVVHCEHPNDSLYKFTGNLILENNVYPVSSENILLRGCSLQNTNWIVGVIIFAGRETKVMMNSLNVPSKRSRLEKKIDKLIYCLLLALLIMSLIGAVCCVYFLDIKLWYLQLTEDTGDMFTEHSRLLVGLLMVLCLVTMYNTMIPISLYVSIEIIKFIQSAQFINMDMSMYDEETNMGAQARTSNLNDELGQVEYILSDKTGTLTQNLMEFVKCSIGGVVYGSDSEDQGAKKTSSTTLYPERINRNRPKCRFYERGFNFYDQRLMGGAWKNEDNQELCREFFRCLAICHTAVVESESSPENINYLASSPDDVALILAAKNLGFFFYRRTPSSIFIRESEAETVGITHDNEYKILNTLEFSSERKCQSTICVLPSGQLVLYIKGAESVIYQRLGNPKSTTAVATIDHMKEFASDGLRTLCVAYRILDWNLYNSWNEKYKEAKSSLLDREEKIRQVADLIEQELILLGCIGIEDKLQDGVPMCINSLLDAGIKVWVLTGDRLETAISVGYAASLITSERRLMVLSLNDKNNLAEPDAKSWFQEQLVSLLTDYEHSCQEKSYNRTLVIDGNCLDYALQPELCDTFLALSCRCFTVICCRVTPLQKAQVTILLRYRAGKVTLSIGDGANDVSMIQAAHVGVAIRGQEGMQAVMASDFVIPKFMFLRNLLLVHGRLSYLRLSKVVNYFFYKNIAITMILFWFTFISGDSGKIFFDDWYQSLYNVSFTSLPVFVVGIFEQDIRMQTSKQMLYPQLYQAGIQNLYFRWPILIRWLISSVIQSLIIFAISVIAGFQETSNGKVLGQWDVGTLAFSSAVVVVNLRLLISENMYSYWHFISVFASIASWFLFLILYTSIWGFWDDTDNVYEQSVVPLSTSIFWFSLLFSSVSCLAVDLALEGFRVRCKPYYLQIVQDAKPLEHHSDPVSGWSSDHLRACLLEPSSNIEDNV